MRMTDYTQKAGKLLPIVGLALLSAWVVASRGDDPSPLGSIILYAGIVCFIAGLICAVNWDAPLAYLHQPGGTVKLLMWLVGIGALLLENVPAALAAIAIWGIFDIAESARRIDYNTRRQPAAPARPAPIPQPAPAQDIEFPCPVCGGPLQSDRALAGETVPCPHCQASVTIPAPAP